MEDPLFRRIRRHASQKLKHPDNMSRDDLLDHYKSYLRLEEEMILRNHRKGDSGLRVAQSRSIVIDVLIENLFNQALASYSAEHGDPPCPIAVLALGGYGRAELCPYSDVDIMFLYPDRVRSQKLSPFLKSITDMVLYILWDVGLKTGHSTRTIKDTIKEAKLNIETKNSQLEARLIIGEDQLFSKFTQSYRNYCRKDSPQAYIKTRLEEQKTRRSRYGNTVFMQEPDIKNGVGGLRDYQNILWMACTKLDVKSIEELSAQNYLHKDEYKKFTTAYDFLLRVRNELHFQSKRSTDLFDLEKQPLVALNLGYKQHDIFKRVETFMRDYYSHARNIYLISKILEKRLALTKNYKVSFKSLLEAHQYSQKKQIDGFILNGKTISYEKETVFEEDAERLIRVFRHSQQFRASLDFDLENLIRTSLHLITKKVINSRSANRSFRSVLQSLGEVFPSLSKMHELGVLERFMPEFSGLTCLVQHEYYHRYTADIHTLNTISELDQVFKNESKIVEKYHHQLHKTDTPGLLYLIILLHDIGKSSGIPGHAIRSAEMATGILDRLGISSEHKDLTLFIIINHLEMGRYSRHFDIDDPQTARAFAEKIGDIDRLRYLYVHTYCDARGTSFNLWNSYKDMLHTALLENTIELLGGTSGDWPGIDLNRTLTAKDSIRELITDISDEEITAHYDLLPEQYFKYTSKQDIALHLRMINNLLQHISEADSVQTLIPVIEWHDDVDLSMTVVHIVTWDRAGLFYKLAGAFSAARLNILSSKAISRSDHILIDTFYVCEPEGGVVQNKHAKSKFHKFLEEALLHNKNLMPDIRHQSKKYTKSPLLNDEKQLQAQLPSNVDVYHESSLQRTIIEVHANDQIGLLYRITKAIFEHGFDITFARISTECGVAVDTFYIEYINQEQPEDTAQLLALRETLNNIVSHDTGKVRP